MEWWRRGRAPECTGAVAPTLPPVPAYLRYMAFISSRLATQQLSKGLSPHVTDLTVGDIHVGDISEVTIELTFEDDTPLDQVIADRNVVQDRFYEMVNGLSNAGTFMHPYFRLRTQSDQREPAETLE